MNKKGFWNNPFTLIAIFIAIIICMGEYMKTVQMTLDEDLINAVDQVVKELNTNRSAFTRQALWEAIKQLKIRQHEEQHRLGYEKFPKSESEFGNWEPEQIWGDE